MPDEAVRSIVVDARLIIDSRDSGWRRWTILEREDFEQVAWECGRQVTTFLAEHCSLPGSHEFVLHLSSSDVPTE